LARSRDISSEEMFAKVHSARPTAYMFEWFISLRRVSAGRIWELGHETKRNETKRNETKRRNVT
jgi:hypothetical protein